MIYLLLAILALFILYQHYEGFEDLGPCPCKDINPHSQVKPILKDNKFDPPMYKNMLVRNCDGTVRIEQVPIGLPFEEITNIYGHGGQTYNYVDDYQNPCPGYPTKRQIDAIGSNYWLPQVCNMCSPNNTCEPSPSDAINFIQKPVIPS